MALGEAQPGVPSEDGVEPPQTKGLGHQESSLLDTAGVGNAPNHMACPPR